MRTSIGFAACVLLAPLVIADARAAEPYGTIIVRPVNPVEPEDGLKAFLAKLAMAAGKKDRKGLAKLLAKDFFWQRDLGGGFDAKAPPAKNFENALSLNEAELEPDYKDIGWERLRELLAARSFTCSAHDAQVVCGPGVAQPADADMAEKVARGFDTTLDFDWVYVEQAPVKVFAAAGGKGAAIAELSWQAVRVVDWGDDNTKADGPPAPLEWIKVHVPSGKEGFIAYGQTVTFLSDRLCYRKDNKGDWRIAGYVGGGD